MDKVTNKFKDFRDGIRGSENTPSYEDKNSFQYLLKTMNKQLTTVEQVTNHTQPVLKSLKELNKLPNLFKEFTDMKYSFPESQKCNDENDFLSRTPQQQLSKTTDKSPKMVRAVRLLGRKKREVLNSATGYKRDNEEYLKKIEEKVICKEKGISKSQKELGGSYKNIDRIKRNMSKSELTHEKQASLQTEYQKSQKDLAVEKEKFKKEVTDFTERDNENVRDMSKYVKKIMARLEEVKQIYYTFDQELENLVEERTIRPCFERKIERHLHDINSEVAAPIKLSIDWMVRNPDRLKIEGLFRIQGGAGQINRLKAQFDDGQYFINDHEDVHTVTTFLKQYLRCLPAALIEKKETARFAQAVFNHKASDGNVLREQLLQAMWKIVNSDWGARGDAVKPNLKHVLEFLRMVSNNGEDNKMTATNLAIVFTPTLFQVEACMTGPDQNLQQAMEYLIDYWDYFFVEEPEKEEGMKKIKDSIKRSPKTQVDLDELMNQLDPNNSGRDDSQKSETSENLYPSIKTKRPAPAIPMGVQHIPRAGELSNDNRPFRQAPVRPIQPEATGLVRPKPTVITQSELATLPEKAFHDPDTMKAMVAGSPLVRTFEEPQTSNFNTQKSTSLTSNPHTSNKQTSNPKISNKSQVSIKTQSSTTQSKNISQNSVSSNNDKEYSISPVVSENRPVPVPRAKQKPPTQNQNSSSRDNLTLVQPRADFQEKTQDIKSSHTDVSQTGLSEDTTEVAFQFTM